MVLTLLALQSLDNEQHLLNYEPGGYHTEWRETVTGYNTVHHEAVYETKYVVDSPQRQSRN